MKPGCNPRTECYHHSCEEEWCPLEKRLEHLRKIAPACIKTQIKPKEKKKPIGPGRSYFREYPVGLLGNISMRQVVYNFEGLTPVQALEIMSNGDCSSNR